MFSFARTLLVAVLIAGLVPLFSANGVIADDAVVVAPCGEQEFDTALTEALTNGGGTITFACGGPTTITFTSQKSITSPNIVVIDGAHLITLDGDNSTRLFTVRNGATLELHNLTVQNGNAGNGNGGAISNNNGVLKIVDSTIRDNETFGDGGAIRSRGTLEITGSTLSHNIAKFSGVGGAVSIQGGSNVTVTNSTLSDNNADEGGGIHNSTTNISVIFNSSTIVNNSAGFEAGGIYNGNGTVTIFGSIVAGNTAALANTGNCLRMVNSLGSNLSNNAHCELNQPTDIQGSSNINLGPLQDNGGPTLTRLPQAGSDALDNAACMDAVDQRGVSRPQGDACDIGAVEVRQGATYALCASYYTGVVTSPLSGDCGAGQFELSVPGDLAFCVNPWTGQVQYGFGRPCAAPRFTHTLPDDGDLLTCVNYSNGANRWVRSHAQCTLYEAPNRIPATS